MPLNSFSGLKVLVTGASGFLGSHLCRGLSAHGAEWHAVARVAHPDGASGRWWRCDLRGTGEVDHLLDTVKPDVIFHLAGHGVGAPDLDHVLPSLQDDLVTTVNVLTAATRRGVARLVLAASLEEPRYDQGDIAPSSPYAAAKTACTAYARMFHHIYRAPIVTVRPFMTYGPAQRAHKLVPYVTRALLRGEAPKLSSGTRRVDWIYVDDVTDGLLAAAHVPGLEGCTVDLGSGVLVSIREVVEQIVRLVGARVEPQFGALSDRPSERVRVADIADAYTKLGWKPVTTLADGLARTVDWYRRELTEAGGSFVAVERRNREESQP